MIGSGMILLELETSSATHLLLEIVRLQDLSVSLSISFQMVSYWMIIYNKYFRWVVKQDGPTF